MAGNLTKEIFKFLKKQPEKQFTVREIVDAIDKKNINNIPKALQEKFTKIKTDETIPSWLRQEFRAMVSVLLAYNAREGRLQRVEGKGLLKYYFTKKLPDEATVESSAEDVEKEKELEATLYPILSSYLKTKAIGSKRINESTSSSNLGKGANRWLHPDVIGIQYLSGNWDPDVKDCTRGTFGLQIKLWSFEVKTSITRGNVRDYFFQAVANSSWANFGYLAIEKIDGADNELRMLCNRHGIGVIILDRENEENNYIHTPAKENYDVDWEMVNRLFKENQDFRDGMRNIRSLYKNERFEKEFWGLEDE